MQKKLLIALAIVFVVVLGCFIWWNVPKVFLKNTDADCVSCIEVFNGNTGEGFTIDDTEDIEYIVNNIQNREMKKDKLSLGRMGYAFRLVFLDENGKVIDKFIINSDDTIRKDPFFYTDETAGLCFDYLNDRSS